MKTFMRLQLRTWPVTSHYSQTDVSDVFGKGRQIKVPL